MRFHVKMLLHGKAYGIESVMVHGYAYRTLAMDNMRISIRQVTEPVLIKSPCEMTEVKRIGVATWVMPVMYGLMEDM